MPSPPRRRSSRRLLAGARLRRRNSSSHLVAPKACEVPAQVRRRCLMTKLLITESCAAASRAAPSAVLQHTNRTAVSSRFSLNNTVSHRTLFRPSPGPAAISARLRAARLSIKPCGALRSNRAAIVLTSFLPRSAPAFCSVEAGLRPTMEMPTRHFDRYGNQIRSPHPQASRL